MIHHDYLLRLLTELTESLARISRLKTEGSTREAGQSVDRELHRCVGTNLETVLRLSETELLARLCRAGTALETRARMLFVVRLLKERGDLALEEADDEGARESYLKALRLLVSAVPEADGVGTPQFAPTVEALVGALRGAPLPLETQAMVMHHYETSGEFAKAEDALFALLDEAPRSPDLFDFGSAFYRRLLARSDESLLQGQLSRAEARDGFATWQNRAAC